MVNINSEGNDLSREKVTYECMVMDWIYMNLVWQASVTVLM